MKKSIVIILILSGVIGYKEYKEEQNKIRCDKPPKLMYYHDKQCRKYW